MAVPVTDLFPRFDLGSLYPDMLFVDIPFLTLGLHI